MASNVGNFPKPKTQKRWRFLNCRAKRSKRVRCLWKHPIKEMQLASSSVQEPVEKRSVLIYALGMFGGVCRSLWQKFIRVFCARPLSRRHCVAGHGSQKKTYYVQNL